MIIPVRCFTCGKVIADKWAEYERRVNATKPDDGKGKDMGKDKDKASNSGASAADRITLDAYRGKILDDLQISRICCRRHMLTHVDLIDII